ncbi:MAG: 16S rRNA (cytidine(1402)-2'-O)-methyltransferase [Chloroflexota bacterium]|nr:16S rRNA (cytidine(1402)-2'-O)-methyltransferase [Chloroflexota bacterium]
MGQLFLVATPIGNLQDVTLRALDVLRGASLIAAEDTRTARRLLDHFGIKAKLSSYNEHNMRTKTPLLLNALDVGDIALVSDAGTPAISDPGHELVVAAIQAGHEIVPVPGASAVLAAIAASGLPSRRFFFVGFLPRQSGPRRRALVAAAACSETLVAFESPHRVRATLTDGLAALGDRRIAVCRELTKLHEEIWRGSISDALLHFEQPRGEFTLVIEGGAAPDAASAREPGDVAATIAAMRSDGVPSKEGIAAIGQRFGISRRAAYAAWHAS